MARPGRARAVMAGVASAGLLLDQATKAWAVAELEPGRPVPLVGRLLQLELIRNPGAAFSMGSGATIVFGLLALVATLVMVFHVAPRVRSMGQGVLAGLATAGIAGNLLDRVFRAPGVLRGHVVDFFHLQDFAIFNVADIFITCVALWLVVQSLVTRREPSAEDTPRDDAAREVAA